MNGLLALVAADPVPAQDHTYAVLLGIAAVIGAVGGIVAAIISGRTKRDTTQINRAVNHQAPEAPTLLQLVKSIDAKLDLLAEDHGSRLRALEQRDHPSTNDWR